MQSEACMLAHSRERVVQVRLVDFNPIGDSTSPLLFDWDELPYGCGTSTASPSAAAAPAQAPGACEAPLPGAGSAAVVSNGPDAGRSHAGAAPAASREARAGDELSGAAPVAQAPAGACNGGTQSASTQANVAPSSPAGQLQGSAGLRPGSTTATADVPGDAGGDGPRHGAVTGGEIMFRVVTEPAGLRPGAAACRAPFDFADTGPGGAVDALLRKLQVETQ